MSSVLAFLVAMVLVVLMVVFEGFAISKLWNWHVAGWWGAPPVPWLVAAVIGLILSVVRFRHRPTPKDESGSDTFLRLFGSTLCALVALIIGGVMVWFK